MYNITAHIFKHAYDAKPICTAAHRRLRARRPFHTPEKYWPHESIFLPVSFCDSALHIALTQSLLCAASAAPPPRTEVHLILKMVSPAATILCVVSVLCCTPLRWEVPVLQMFHDVRIGGVCKGFSYCRPPTPPPLQRAFPSLWQGALHITADP